MRLAAFRIAEEALTNVVEHAQAAKATVRLDVSRFSWLRLTVGDDGRGFDVERPFDGLGIGTMQDYAEAVDGQCSVEASQARARWLRQCSRSRRLAKRNHSPRKKEASDGIVERVLPLVP